MFLRCPRNPPLFLPSPGRQILSHWAPHLHLLPSTRSTFICVCQLCCRKTNRTLQHCKEVCQKWQDKIPKKCDCGLYNEDSGRNKLIVTGWKVKKKKKGGTRIWTGDLSICSRMLYHWAIPPDDETASNRGVQRRCGNAVTVQVNRMQLKGSPSDDNDDDCDWGSRAPQQ